MYDDESWITREDEQFNYRLLIAELLQLATWFAGLVVICLLVQYAVIEVWGIVRFVVPGGA